MRRALNQVYPVSLLSSSASRSKGKPLCASDFRESWSTWQERMACSSPSPGLSPILNPLLSADLVLDTGFAWLMYLVIDPADSPYNNSATLELARQSIESCPGWDLTCQNSSQIFTNQTFLGICSLYPNVTGQIGNDHENVSRPKDPAIIPAIKSIIPTCLISYCAVIPTCSQTDYCTSSVFSRVAVIYQAKAWVGAGMRYVRLLVPMWIRILEVLG